MTIRCQFNLVGSGKYPISAEDFKDALGASFSHYTNTSAFHMTVTGSHYSIDIDDDRTTADSVRKDMQAIADFYGLALENFMAD